MKNRVEEFRNLVQRGWVKEQIMSEMKVSERDFYRLASLAGVRPKTRNQMFIRSMLLAKEPVSKIAQILGTPEKFVHKVAKENQLALPENPVEPDILDQLEALVKKNYRSARISRRPWRWCTISATRPSAIPARTRSTSACANGAASTTMRSRCASSPSWSAATPSSTG